jgi:HSP20 family protein
LLTGGTSNAGRRLYHHPAYRPIEDAGLCPFANSGITSYDSVVAFTRWDPFRDLIALQEQLGQLVGTDAPGWTPPVDLYETADAFVLSAELPGLTRDQIDIHAEETQIVIRGHRDAGARGHGVSCEQYHRVERGHGRFARAFTLPDPIDVTGVTADLRDGVLTVTLPKIGRESRHIDVS